MSLSGRRNFTRKVCSSSASNCAGCSREPAAIWKVGKPPIASARSKLHFTSAAVTGVPSWKTAFLRRKNVTLPPSFAVSHRSASSGSSLP